MGVAAALSAEHLLRGVAVLHSLFGLFPRPDALRLHLAVPQPEIQLLGEVLEGVSPLLCGKGEHVLVAVHSEHKEKPSNTGTLLEVPLLLDFHLYDSE